MKSNVHPVKAGCIKPKRLDLNAERPSSFLASYEQNPDGRDQPVSTDNRQVRGGDLRLMSYQAREVGAPDAPVPV